MQVRTFAFILSAARWAGVTVKTGFPPESLEFFQHVVVGMAVFCCEYQSMFPMKGLLVENLHYFERLHVPRGNGDGSLFVIFDHKIILRLRRYFNGETPEVEIGPREKGFSSSRKPVTKNVRNRIYSAGQHALKNF